MKIQYYIYVVTDSHGNKASVVANDSTDIVQIIGLKSKEGERHYFESEAYHLDNWCDENGLQLKRIDMSADV